MRFLLAALMLFSVSFSQFENVDERLLDCEKACCASANYSWGASCDVFPSRPAYLGYTACGNRCREDAQKGIYAMASHPDFCCGPGLIFAFIFAFSNARDGWGRRPAPPLPLVKR
jgi:hypothetical protein